MPKQKWSGVKLTKKEQQEIKKQERVEIIAEIMTFVFIIAIGVAVVGLMLTIMRCVQ